MIDEKVNNKQKRNKNKSMTVEWPEARKKTLFFHLPRNWMKLDAIICENFSMNAVISINFNFNDKNRHLGWKKEIKHKMNKSFKKVKYTTSIFFLKAILVSSLFYQQFFDSFAETVCGNIVIIWS